MFYQCINTISPQLSFCSYILCLLETQVYPENVVKIISVGTLSLNLLVLPRRGDDHRSLAALLAAPGPACLLSVANPRDRSQCSRGLARDQVGTEAGGRERDKAAAQA